MSGLWRAPTLSSVGRWGGDVFGIVLSWIFQGDCEDAWRGRRSRSIEDQSYEVGIAQIMGESQGLMVERQIVVQDRVAENEKATDFTDNIGFSVIMPGGEFY
jgi:hypothetical protein